MDWESDNDDDDYSDECGSPAVPEVGSQSVVGVLVLAVDLVEVERPHE